MDNMAREQYWASVRTGYTGREEHRHMFENDKENPYLEKAGRGFRLDSWVSRGWSLIDVGTPKLSLGTSVTLRQILKTDTAYRLADSLQRFSSVV